MKTQIFAKTESELLPYLPAYKAIMSATGFMGVEVDKNTGVMQEVVKPFSAEQKLVWLYALDRYRFFSKDNKEWFDNQIDIAEACNVSDSCVKKFFRALREANVIKSKGTRIGGHNSNSYIILKDLVLVQKDNSAQKLSISLQVERSASTDTNVAPPVKEPVKVLEEVVEDEEDFNSMIEIASDNYNSYSEQVEKIQYRTEPDRAPWDVEDDVEEPSFMKVKAPGKKSNFEPWMFMGKNLNSFKKGSEWDECLINFMLDSGIAEPYRVLTGGDDNDFSFNGDRYQFNARSGYIIPSELPF